MCNSKNVAHIPDYTESDSVCNETLAASNNNKNDRNTLENMLEIHLKSS